MKFSPSSLQEYQRCPRCFWLARNKGIKPPRGIYPSLPGKMDELLKSYYDFHRAVPALPEEISTLLDRKLLYSGQESLARWREWSTGLVAKSDGLEISGMLDDALEAEGGLLSVLDYKTKGDRPAPDYSERYYQVAADCYDAMLRTVGDTDRKAYFVYYSPLRIAGANDMAFDEVCAPLEVTLQVIEASPERAFKLAHDAQDCLVGPLPPVGEGCEMCAYVNRRLAFGAGAARGKGKRGKR